MAQTARVRDVAELVAKLAGKARDFLKVVRKGSSEPRAGTPPAKQAKAETPPKEGKEEELCEAHTTPSGTRVKTDITLPLLYGPPI